MGYSQANLTEGDERSFPSIEEILTPSDPRNIDCQRPNEKAAHTLDGNHIKTDATGVKKVEAAVLAWDKKTVLAIYACLPFCHQWQRHPQGILEFSNGPRSCNCFHPSYSGRRSSQAPYRQDSQHMGTCRSIDIFTGVFLLGIIVLASCGGPNGYAAGYVLYWVGYDAIYLILNVFIADTSGLRNRAFAFAFSSTPFICTAFTGPRAAQSFLNMSTWRWAYYAFAIIFPFVLFPLAIVFKFYERKAEKLGIYKPEKTGRSWIQSIVHYIHEFDVVGGTLLMAAFILLLLPFSMATYGRAGYSSATFIAMLVIGFCLLFVFAAWEKFFARKQFIRYELLKLRTVVGACLLSAVSSLGYSAWDLYFMNFAMVVYNLSISDAGYMGQIYNVGSCFWAPLFGIYVRQTKHFKKACLFFGLPLMLLGSGLMIHFRGQDGAIGYIAMCQIFIAVAGGTLVIGQEMAVMSAADHDGVPMMLSILGLFGSLGGAAGSTACSAIYTNIFPKALIAGLPANSKADWNAIYVGGYVAQMQYPMGSDIRNAINAAWGDAQKYTCIVTTAAVALGWPCISIWRNVNVDKEQVPGVVL